MLRLGLAQINPTVGDFAGNLQKIADYIEKGKKQRCHLILFPELVLCGYPPEDLLLKKNFQLANNSYISKLAKLAKKITIICGYARSEAGKLYNSAAVMVNGRVRYNYDKIALPNYGVFDEKRYFVTGNSAPVLDLGELRFGLNICEDIWIEKGITKAQAELGASLILNLSASPYHHRRGKERIKMLQRRARNNRCYIAYTNLVGGQDELVFDGESLVVSSDGKIVARAAQFSEELLIVDLPAGRRQKDKPRLSPNKKITFDGKEYGLNYLELSTITLRQNSGRKSNKIAKSLPATEEIYQALVLGCRDYIRKNGFRSAIIGMSGGIDSALTAAIAIEAIGKRQTYSLFMPSRFTSKLSRQAAYRQAELLGIKQQEICIDGLYGNYLAQLSQFFEGYCSDSTEENLQARIRGNLLMAFANKFGHLALNTGNKSETAVGYSTLYGDMVGGFAVLKDIPKTLVFKLCRHLNRSRGREIIARMIINRSPSAELKADQLDSDALPPYGILDQVLKLYIEDDLPEGLIVAAGFDRKIVHRVIDMVDSAEHKRRQSPPGLKITPRAFGKDRRLPITNKFRR